MVFPEGERFFVDSVMQFRSSIDDEVLLGRIADFASQEGMHSKEHLALNAIVRRAAPAACEQLERSVKLLLRRGSRTHSAAGRLAVTSALEHFTAIMAEQLLAESAQRDDFHPAVRGLWLWHALEETEHKSVAFEVYQRVDGSYWRRVLVMLTTTLFFFGIISVAHFRMLREQRGSRDFRGLLRTFDHFWIRPGYFRRLIPGYLRYFSPSFHPDRHDTRDLVLDWRERLFGADGSLSERLGAARPGRQAA
jgi:predicted metal-dependent hydrolase